MISKDDKPTLTRLIRAAQAEQGVIHHVAAGRDEIHHVTVRPAAASGPISLSRELADTLPAVDGRTFRALIGERAGNTVSIDAAVAEESLVARAGARIILVPQTAEARPVGTTGDVAFMKRPTRFEIVSSAAFSRVPDGQQVQESPFPATREEVDLDDSTSWAFRTTLTRRDQKDYGADVLAAEAMASIVAGLAATADKVFLERLLMDGTLQNFSLTAAAAKRLRFEELRALTSGTGADVDASGALRVAGVPAELCADLSNAAVVGAFSHGAVAISEEVNVLVQKDNKSGDLHLTCWALADAVIPTLSYFWKAA